MRFLKLTLLLSFFLQAQLAFAKYCDGSPNDNPPPGCRCSGINVVCDRPRANITNNFDVLKVGLPPHCSMENKKRYCGQSCTIHNSSGRAYLNVDCYSTCMNSQCY